MKPLPACGTATGLLDLPPELLLHVLGQGTGRSSARAAATCKDLAKLAEEPSLWRTLCERASLIGGDSTTSAASQEDWKARYVRCALCNHSCSRQFQWHRRTPGSPLVWLAPNKGPVLTHCTCSECGREFDVEACARYEQDAAHSYGRDCEEFAVVKTTLRLRAKRPSHDAEMDEASFEQEEDFVMY